MALLDKELSKLANMEDVSVEAAAMINGENAKDIFCKNWDGAKKALGAAQAMVKNPVVKVIIGVLINVGDALKKTTCPQ